MSRYYFSEKIPNDHHIITFEADAKAQAILNPHSSTKLSFENFPIDDKGRYFEIKSPMLEGTTLSFKVRHVRRRGQISIFITCSIVGGTGNGMIIDLVALVKDIFKDY